MRLVCDENVPIASAHLLRQRGHKVESIGETMSGAADTVILHRAPTDILHRAPTERSLILTHDRDYGELLYKHQLPKPPGVVYFNQQPLTPTETAELFLKLTVPIVGFYTTGERDRIRQRPI